MLSIEEIQKYDSADMFFVLKSFPEQLAKAVEIAKDFKGFPSAKPASQDIVVIGMGGSAIGGDLLRNFMSYSDIKNKVKVTVCRDYEIPHFVDDKTNIICSSYSGNTEETISAAKAALQITKRIVCITTGGELLEFAKANELPFVLIPGGLQPRCAVGYSIIPMLFTVINSGFVTKAEAKKAINSIDSALAMSKELSEDFSQHNEPNIATTIADMLKNSIPLIYSSDKFYAANLRWRCQIQENCKSIVFGNVLPEMNHNEINSFDLPADLIERISMVIFNDESDHPRTKIRFEAVKEVLEEKVETIIEITASSDDYFTKVIEYLYLGDWVSYYMAILQEIDPTPIPLINKLKAILADAK